MLILESLGIIVISSVLLYVAGELLVSGALRLAKYLRVTEFVVAFFVMAFAATLPNLFVGITSALQGIPELSFGDIMGNNIIALTVAAGLGIFFSPKKELPFENQAIQDTTFFTAVAAILPIILISDNILSRSDGLVLVLFFAGYVYWLLAKNSRFTKVYDTENLTPPELKKDVFKDLVKIVAGITLMAMSAQGIVVGASGLAEILHLPLVLVGILILGLGGALPEVYFTILSARRGDTSMILGNLMGAVIIPVTLVLGIVAMIEPVHNDRLDFPIMARVFLVIVALYFLYISQARSVVTKRDGVILIVCYLLFITSFLFMSFVV